MENIIYTILEDIHNGKDGSIHVGTGERPTKGYMVGGASWTMTVASEMLDAYVLADFLNAHRAILSWEEKYLGWWTHKGRVYFDVADNVTDAHTAVTLGQYRKEIAIFNLNRMEEVTL